MCLKKKILVILIITLADGNLSLIHNNLCTEGEAWPDAKIYFDKAITPKAPCINLCFAPVFFYFVKKQSEDFFCPLKNAQIF